MKKIISLILATITAVTIVGCSKQDDTSSKKTSSKSITTSTTSNNVFTPFTLNDNSIYPTAFIINGTSTIFTNWEDNNKISILDEPYAKTAITTSNISDFFNYSASTLTIVNNIIYFGDSSSSSNLASINMTDKTYTKLNNRHVHEITSLNNEKIFYLDIPESSTNTKKLYTYDINEKTDSLVTSDNVGKYVINNNFILYQNLSDGSKLYKVNIDGSNKTKVTDYSVNSFAVYSSQILVSNSDDNNNLYIIDPSTLDSKRFSILSVTDLKSLNNEVYCLNESNLLCKLNITIESSDTTLTPLSSDSINEYYPTEKGIFVQKGININNPYLITVN